MPLFAVQCRDGPDAAAKREQALDAHLRHIERVIDRIRVAGPLLNEKGNAVGSLLIIEAERLAEAEALAASDPYAKAGVWAEMAVTPFRGVAGSWVGGITWPTRLVF